MEIFFSVGEPSGDLHGANLIAALSARRPGLRFVGYGGPKMAAAGCRLHKDLTQLAIMWFLRVFLNLHKFLWLLLQADRYFRDHRPSAVVLIDYPGFNWWIARRAKARGIPVFYYGTPQVWAWAPWRVKKMQRFVDHVLCKLPFEEAWYAERNCQATYVGHPYFDELENQSLDPDFLRQQQTKPGQLVTLLPGSRGQEISANLPAFLQTAKQIRAQVPTARFAIAAFSEKHAAQAFELALTEGIDVEVHVGRTAELIYSADCCLACSGSVSLELLFHEKPSVIHYRISPLALWVQSHFRQVKYITLVNLLAEQDIFYDGEYFTYDPDAPGAHEVIFPEYLTSTDRTTDMARRLVAWLKSPSARKEVATRLREIKRQMVGIGASRRGADYILNQLEKPQGRTVRAA